MLLRGLFGVLRVFSEQAQGKMRFGSSQEYRYGGMVREVQLQEHSRCSIRLMIYFQGSASTGSWARKNC